MSSPRSHSRKVVDALFKVFRGFSDEPLALPYASEFRLPEGFQLPRDLSLSSYPGLVACHIAKSDANLTKVMVYWQDAEHFRARQETFRKDAGLPEPSWTGTVVGLHVQKERLWKRFSWAQAILTAAAIFGAFSAFRDYFAEYFHLPKVAVTFSDVTPLNYVEGTQISIPITVLNEDRFASSTIVPQRLTATRHGVAQAVHFDFDVFMLPVVSPGRSANMTASGTAPDHTKPRGPPDEYQLEVQVTAQTGRWVGWRTFTSNSPRALRVWSKHVAWTPIRIVDCRQNCVMESVIYTGSAYPQGVQGHVILTSASEDQIVDLDVSAPLITRTQKLPVSQTSTLITRKVEFQTEPLEKFQDFKLEVFVQAAKPVAAGRWQELAKGIEIRVQ